jgi:hypothetical protein
LEGFSHGAERRGRSGAAMADTQNPEKPGFRRKAPEMRPNFLKNLHNVKSLICAMLAKILLKNNVKNIDRINSLKSFLKVYKLFIFCLFLPVRLYLSYLYFGKHKHEEIYIHIQYGGSLF